MVGLGRDEDQRHESLGAAIFHAVVLSRGRERHLSGSELALLRAYGEPALAFECGLCSWPGSKQ
jgi:hypothetical protein